MFLGLQFNLIPLILGLIIYIAVGSIWYSPTFLGKQWMQLKNLNDNDLKNAGSAMALSTISAIVSVVGIYLLVQWSGSQSFVEGVIIGLLATALANTSAFNAVCFDKSAEFTRRLKIFAIDISNMLVSYVSIAVLLTLWI